MFVGASLYCNPLKNSYCMDENKFLIAKSGTGSDRQSHMAHIRNATVKFKVSSA